MDLISWFIWLLVLLIVGSLLWWALNKVLAAFGVPDPIRTVAQVLFVLVAVLVILGAFTGHVPLVPLRRLG